MSIYASLWQLKFPKDGDDYVGCEWITVTAGYGLWMTSRSRRTTRHEREVTGAASPRTDATEPAHYHLRPWGVMDLPNYSVLIAGLDHWFPPSEEIAEPRLTEKLCRLLDVPSLPLHMPPPDQEDPMAPPSEITAWQFPEWFVTQDVNIAGGAKTALLWLIAFRPCWTTAPSRPCIERSGSA
jgi:hypothetical protein